MDHRKNYLDGLSRTKLQALAKVCMSPHFGIVSQLLNTNVCRNALALKLIGGVKP
jgi:hypothetical protein